MRARARVRGRGRVRVRVGSEEGEEGQAYHDEPCDEGLQEAQLAQHGHLARAVIAPRVGDEPATVGAGCRLSRHTVAGCSARSCRLRVIRGRVTHQSTRVTVRDSCQSVPSTRRPKKEGTVTHSGRRSAAASGTPRTGCSMTAGSTTGGSTDGAVIAPLVITPTVLGPPADSSSSDWRHLSAVPSSEGV